MNKLYRVLEEYSKKDIYPFHMPGHKRNSESLPGFFPTGEDITEIDGFDNLHHPEGILKEAQDFTARIYGVQESFYSVNGSTAALLSAVSACVKREGKILMARNCHKAAYHAVYLRNLKPVYLYPPIETKLWINGGILPEDVEKSLKEDAEIQAVLITSPTYDGIVSDIKKIAEIAHRYQVPLIVDEAHGAHFHFSDYFPASAAEMGADLVIQSLHKTLPSMTQTAVLHRCTDRTDPDLIRRFMGIYQSSSPSYVLMASMDACMDRLALHGKELFQEFTENLKNVRERLSKRRNICLITPEKSVEKGIYDYDRSKILLSVRETSFTGRQLQKTFLERFHLQMEMASECYVIALTAVGDVWEGFERLCEAVEVLDEEEMEKSGLIKEKSEEQYLEAETEKKMASGKEVMSIASAMEGLSSPVLIKDSAGRISAEFAYLYPPGIPLFVPGEQITGQMVENVRRYINQGLELQGLSDYSGRTIRVVC